MIVLEACVDSIEAAAIAASAGADRVELCADLVEGGTTPSIGAIERAVVDVAADVMVMIRPRGGDFVYNRRELAIMERDIEAVRGAGAVGVVLGCLTPKGDVDRPATRTLMQETGDLSVTFHRAFDVCRDPHDALESLIDLGVDRVLTSGQQPSAPQGLELIADLVRAADSRITVMPGVGIDAGNILRVATATRAREFHVYTERARPSTMSHRKDNIPMGRRYEPDDYVVLEPDADQIAAMVRALKGRPSV
ncbi:MAG: copper homeostasis protein CutC [Acidobacteriota bacterium]|jgi:copper homeostasis protein